MQKNARVLVYLLTHRKNEKDEESALDNHNSRATKTKWSPQIPSTVFSVKTFQTPLILPSNFKAARN